MSTPPPDLGVYISPAQTYAEVRAIGDRQIRMDEKIDRFLEDAREHRAATDDHEKRLRALEARMWMAMGAAVVLGAGTGAGLSQIMGR